MTDEQKLQIKKLRKDGHGYVRIAKALGLSENTVRSFCRRNELLKNSSETQTPAQNCILHFCRCCGIPVEQNPGRKEKKFCSDKCRMKWWNSHPEEIHRKSARDIVCKNCGKVFLAYNSARKYCCHECYIEDRFGGEEL
ncbi:MAG: helix-turn-helix domain-containing protein [Oscillospiraceae bacterium]|nr:helix-turn-helix domain-containing protein [Oscillospiraceae bacterium]